jgi:hypothetical protein
MAAAVTLVGGVVGAIGALAAAGSQQAAADYNQQVSWRNEAMIRNETYLAAEDKRSETRRLIGSIKASYGQNNLAVDGTAIDVIQDSLTQSEYDVAKIQYKGQAEAQGQHESATLFGMESSSAETAGYFGAGSRLLAGISGALTQKSNAGSSLLEDYGLA